ncbi:VOC family protein [Nocardiopsis oceani]
MASPEQARYPEGVPCWVELSEPHPEHVIAFFGEVLGWHFEDRTPEGARNRHFVARLRDREGDVAGVGSLIAEPAAPVWTTYVRVDSADDAAERVDSAGGNVLSGPTDIKGVARVALCADSAGARFGLWEPRGSGGAHLVNEPGTWNFSTLVTSDPEAAATFYGTVFGWQTQNVRLGGGSAEATMFRLPEYGEFLEGRNPGTRDAHTEAGAPEGFTDAVGWLSAVPYEALADTVPQWGVEFTVSDAESVLNRAAQLGGTVVTPLADMGGMRYGAFQDARGAAMGVNEFHHPPD